MNFKFGEIMNRDIKAFGNRSRIITNKSAQSESRILKLRRNISNLSVAKKTPDNSFFPNQKIAPNSAFSKYGAIVATGANKFILNRSQTSLNTLNRQMKLRQSNSSH